MKQKFILFRHGNVSDKRGMPGLTPLGREQAEATGKHLLGLPLRIDAIYASPSQRAIETAAIAQRFIGIKQPELLREDALTTNAALKERMDFGDSPYEKFEDFLKEWQRTLVDRDYQPTSGDSSRAAGRRFLEFMHQVPRNFETVAIFAHGGVIRDAVENLIDERHIKRAEADTLMPRFSRIKDEGKGLSHCSMTIITFDEEGKYALEFLGSTKHLEKDQGIETEGSGNPERRGW
jgi:broad specificity phosphatase PhoE